MKNARVINTHNDITDALHGNATPRNVLYEHGDEPAYIRTVMAAIEAGIGIGDWACVAEAQGMLEDYLTYLEKKRA